MKQFALVIALFSIIACRPGPTVDLATRPMGPTNCAGDAVAVVTNRWTEAFDVVAQTSEQ